MNKKDPMNDKNAPADAGAQALVTSAEVSRLAGVSRAVVANWRKRYEDFPQPAADGPLFRLSEIEKWLAGHAKKRTTAHRAVIRPEQRLWHALGTIGEAEDGLAFAARFLAALAKAEEKPKDGEELLALIDRDDPIRKLSTEQLTPIAVEMARLSQEKGTEGALEELLLLYAEDVTSGYNITPKPIADLMVRLIEGAPASVLDPACGAGSLLAAAAQRCTELGSETPQLFGQDISSEMAQISSSLLAMRELEVDIQEGDSLREDHFAEQHVEAVISNPPLGDRDWGFEELVHDTRWHFGRPPRLAPELAWLQHAYAHLLPGGQATILLPGTAASSPVGRAIRKEAVRQGAVEAIIALPGGLFPGIHLSFQAHLWVLRRPKHGEIPPSRILLIDAGDARRSRSFNPSVVERVLRRCEEFRRDPTAADEAGFSRAVSAVQIMDDVVDLTPAVHIVQPGGDPADAATQFAESARGLSEGIKKVGKVSKALKSVTSKEVAPPPLVTIGTLADEGLLRIFKGYRPLLRSQDQPTSNSLRLLKGRDLVKPGEAEFVAPDALPSVPELTRRGDIAIAELVPERVVAVVLEEEGLLPASGVVILRAPSESLDPYFVAGFLRSKANLRFLRGGRVHLDVRRLEVPRVTIETQRRIGALLQVIEEGEREIARVGSSLDELRSSLLAGLLGGTMVVTVGDPSISSK